MKNELKFQDYVDRIEFFFRQNGIEIDPVPGIKIDYEEHDILDPFCPTGNYNPETQTITLYVSNRQLKDILRSFCHELVHHNQNLKMKGEFQKMDLSGKLKENQQLAQLESDAYNRGNLLFRAWTEEAKPM